MNLPLRVIQKATHRICIDSYAHKGFPGGAVVRNLPVSAGDAGVQVQSWVGKVLWRREWQSAPVFLPGESHGQRCLEGYTVHSVAKSRV